MTDSLFELWTSRLSCGCWTKPIGSGGVPYGALRVGSYIGCNAKLAHQGTYKVLETKPYPESS